MVAVNPKWINAVGLDALALRRNAALHVMTNGVALGGRAGIVPGSGGFTVTVSGTTITVSAGTAWLYQSGQGMYSASLSSGASLTLTAAHATLPRVDLVYLRVWDNAVDASGLNQADAVYLAGTAAASPVAPTPAGTQIYIPLATISVPASGGGSPSVSQTVLPKTVAPGGILPDAAATGYYAGQYRDNGTGLERYNGSAWVPAAPGIGTADWEADVKLGATRKLIIGTDVNLYRSAANVLKTDDDLVVKTHKVHYGASAAESVTFASAVSHLRSITFATAFSAVPRVFTNINNGSGPAAQWKSRAINITTTSFDLFLFHDSASAWSGIEVQWAAFAS